MCVLIDAVKHLLLEDQVISVADSVVDFLDVLRSFGGNDNQLLMPFKMAGDESWEIVLQGKGELHSVNI